MVHLCPLCHTFPNGSSAEFKQMLEYAAYWNSGADSRKLTENEACPTSVIMDSFGGKLARKPGWCFSPWREQGGLGNPLSQSLVIPYPYSLFLSLTPVPAAPRMQATHLDGKRKDGALCITRYSLWPTECTLP